MTDDVNWAEVSDPDWEPEFERRTSGLLVQLVGRCPRCTHPTTTNFPRVVVPEGVRADTEPVIMYCKCGHPHGGHPEGDNSCGAYWPYQVEL